MANQEPISWKTGVGLNHVGAYQVSGQPYATGSLNAASANLKIQFPDVTRWVQVINNGNNTLKVGFSDKGLTAGNYFEVETSGSSGILDLKVSEIHLRGGEANKVSVVAGLTNIDSNKTSTAKGSSFPS